jgi:hypothetical protein
MDIKIVKKIITSLKSLKMGQDSLKKYLITKNNISTMTKYNMNENIRHCYFKTTDFTC